MNDMDEHNLPVPDDLPYLNLSQSELDECSNVQVSLQDDGQTLKVFLFTTYD